VYSRPGLRDWLTEQPGTFQAQLYHGQRDMIVCCCSYLRRQDESKLRLEVTVGKLKVEIQRCDWLCEKPWQQPGFPRLGKSGGAGGSAEGGCHFALMRLPRALAQYWRLRLSPPSRAPPHPFNCSPPSLIHPPPKHAFTHLPSLHLILNFHSLPFIFLHSRFPLWVFRKFVLHAQRTRHPPSLPC
jgi:hypothetical protein